MDRLKQPVKAALYMRLSQDDAAYGESVSIETQRSIITAFAREHHFQIVDEYVDDGWSGTSFDRPDFERMMRDVDAGKVNCIVTKDLSRFGREHVQMDYYLEFYFPNRGIRYIAVTEGEDTEKGLSDFVPFKNLFNEWYTKDTSRKVKAAHKAKFDKGERIFAYPPLGYKRHPDERNKLVIDGEACWIVEKIFDLAYHGAGPARIAHVLKDEQVPTPGWLNFQRYGTFANVYADAPEKKRYNWTVSQVRKILRDETYIGNTVHYRQTKISYKNAKRVNQPPDQWQIVEGTQEPIVSRDVFERVQEQIAKRRRPRKNNSTQIFAGLLRCADCGWGLSYSTNKGSKTPYSFYTCTNYAQGLGNCTNHYIRYDMLCSFVLSRIQYWTRMAQCDEEGLVRRLMQTSDREHTRAGDKAADELKKAEKRLKELDVLFAKLYEDSAAGRISERNYSMLSALYQDEQEKLDGKIAALRQELAKDKQEAENVRKWVDLVKQYTRPEELTAPLLNALIEKILVHQAVKLPDGTRVQEIEIFYRFVGKIDE